MNELPLHISLAIEAELRMVQRGEKPAMKALADLITRFPQLQQNCERGMAHPCARIVLETPDGRELAKRLGLDR